MVHAEPFTINLLRRNNYHQQIIYHSPSQPLLGSSFPTNGCSLELRIPFLKLTNKEQASISWKPEPLAANVTRNMIGAAANSCMHVVGSQ